MYTLAVMASRHNTTHTGVRRWRFIGAFEVDVSEEFRSWFQARSCLRAGYPREYCPGTPQKP
jgi:hypothetical protein